MKPENLVKKAEKVVHEFVDEKLGNDEVSFSFVEAESLANDVGIHVSSIVKMAKEAGLEYSGREVPRKVRGFTANSHDRWSGPGSCQSHGGSGWQQINGLAGIEG